MTILSYDLKMLAADTLTTAGDIKVYNRSKLRIVKKHAIASTGLENDGFRFDKWFFEQNGEPFITEDYLAVFVLSTSRLVYGVADVETDHKLSALAPVISHMSIGATEATAAANILMKVVKFNAHNAATEAANYHTHCGSPVYSITKKQLEYIHVDFSGYWIGTYKTPLNKIEDYLITEKQWLKT